MRIYWDSSALVAALHDEQLRSKLGRETGFTRSHALAEVFSTLTGGRLGFRYSPNDGSDLVASLAADLSLTDLSPEELLSALRRAEKLGVRGGRVHDYLHAVAAEKIAATKIWTFNLSDFQTLVQDISVESP